MADIREKVEKVREELCQERLLQDGMVLTYLKRMACKGFDMQGQETGEALYHAIYAAAGARAMENAAAQLEKAMRDDASEDADDVEELSRSYDD